MRTKLTIIAIAALTGGLFANTGGLPNIEDRVSDLERLALMQSQQIEALNSKVDGLVQVGVIQNQRIGALEAQIAAIKPSPFSEAQVKDLTKWAEMIYIHKDESIGALAMAGSDGPTGNKFRTPIRIPHKISVDSNPEPAVTEHPPRVEFMASN